MTVTRRVAVLGAGIQGVCAALELARRGCVVDLYEREPAPMTQASRWNEGKIHLGFIYANDAPERTARTLLAGSLRFAGLLRRWVPLDDLGDLLSEPFTYVVHRDSLIGVDAVEAHFASVAGLHRDLSDGLGATYLDQDSRRLYERVRPIDLDEAYDPRRVVAAFRTVERSIDPHALADRLVAAVRSEPRITVLVGHAVDRVVDDERGRLWVHATDPDGFGSKARYEHVVNALWADRLRVDATRGIVPRRPWLFRYKLALHARLPAGVAVPTTSIVLGPFGDVVDFGSGRIYLSWYPVCRVGAWTTPEAPPLEHDQEGRQQVLEASVRALGEVIPSVGELALEERSVDVAGGVIFGWGATDVDDAASELHQRFDIGVTTHGTYHSVDTGKYCTAPLFALDVARRIAPGV